jgi:hypothetical protein
MSAETIVDERFVAAYDTYNQQLDQLVNKPKPRVRRSYPPPPSPPPRPSMRSPCKNGGVGGRGVRFIVNTALIATCTIAMLFFMRTDPRSHRDGRTNK